MPTSITRSPRSADAPVVSTSTTASGSSNKVWMSENGINSPRSSEFRSNDIALEHHLPVHQALRAAGNSFVTLPDFGDEDVQPHARRDLLPELAAFQPAETDKALPANVLLDVNAGELGGGLDHQHAGQ